MLTNSERARLYLVTHPKRVALKKKFSYSGTIYNDKRVNGRSLRVVGWNHQQYVAARRGLARLGIAATITLSNDKPSYGGKRYRLMVED